MLSIRDASGQLKPISAISLRTSAGLVALKELSIRDNSGLHEIWSADNSTQSSDALSATASPSSVSGAAAQSSSRSVSTSYTTVTVTGGRKPFIYQWRAVPGWTISDPNSAKTSFSMVVGENEVGQATFVCTITDATGKTAETNEVYASVQNYGPLDGSGRKRPGVDEQ